MPRGYLKHMNRQVIVGRKVARGGCSSNYYDRHFGKWTANRMIVESLYDKPMNAYLQQERRKSQRLRKRNLQNDENFVDLGCAYLPPDDSDSDNEEFILADFSNLGVFDQATALTTKEEVNANAPDPDSTSHHQAVVAAADDNSVATSATTLSTVPLSSGCSDDEQGKEVPTEDNPPPGSINMTEAKCDTSWIALPHAVDDKIDGDYVGTFPGNLGHDRKCDAVLDQNHFVAHTAKIEVPRNNTETCSDSSWVNVSDDDDSF